MHHRTLQIALPCLLVAFVTTSGAARAADVDVPRVKDLHRDAEMARERGLPILVMFASMACPYCATVEEEFLRPMLISGDYDNKVIIRKLTIDGFDDLKDFEGKEVGADAFAFREDVYLTPTLKFYDHRGRELVPDMVGINTVDFYGGYLDASIEKALRILRNRSDGDRVASSTP